MTNIPSLHVCFREHTPPLPKLMLMSALLRYTRSEPREPRDRVREEGTKTTGQQWRLSQRQPTLLTQQKVGSAGCGACGGDGQEKARYSIFHQAVP